MTNIYINRRETLITSDKNFLTYVEGDFTHSNFSIGVQPTSIAYIGQEENCRKGQNLEIKDNSKPIYMLEVENKDTWQIYGSDHNSGVLWFGQTKEVDKIHEEVKNIYLNYPKSMSFKDLTEEQMHISSSPIIRWDFDDNTSLVIAYISPNYQKMNNIEKVKGKDVISYTFGASMDDRRAHEFVQPHVAKLLKKIQYPCLDIDIEDLGDEDDYPIEINGKNIKPKHNKLILNLAKHLHCSILQLQEIGSEDDSEDINVAIAKKIEKNEIINRLRKPETDIDTRLTYVYNSSSKEYNISFVKENDNYIVKTSYGHIGRSMTKDTRVSTTNIEEAQNIYLGLVKEKLTKGYDLNKNYPKIDHIGIKI